MLHPINTSDYFQALLNVLDFQRQVLAFACNPPGSLNDKATFVSAFGDVNGPWLFRKTSLRPEMATIRDHVIAHAGHDALILAAFDNDSQFHTRVADNNFTFHFNTVFDDTLRDTVRPLMESFYDPLLKTGIPESVHGVVDYGDLTRSRICDTFVTTHPKLGVCVACDTDRPDNVDEKFFAHEDHHLPKSKYPFLSIHPYNLVPVCSPCNEDFKGAEDPIDDHVAAPLPNIFQPYVASILSHATVLTVREAKGEYRVRLCEANGAQSRRTQNYSRLYKLDGRWNGPRGRLQRAMSGLQTHFRDLARHDVKRFGQLVTKAEFLKELAEEANSRRGKTGEAANGVLDWSYAACVILDPLESDELYQQYAAAGAAEQAKT